VLPCSQKRRKPREQWLDDQVGALYRGRSAPGRVGSLSRRVAPRSIIAGRASSRTPRSPPGRRDHEGTRARTSAAGIDQGRQAYEGHDRHARPSMAPALRAGITQERSSAIEQGDGDHTSLRFCMARMAPTAEETGRRRHVGKQSLALAEAAKAWPAHADPDADVAAEEQRGDTRSRSQRDGAHHDPVSPPPPPGEDRSSRPPRDRQLRGVAQGSLRLDHAPRRRRRRGAGNRKMRGRKTLQQASRLRNSR